MIHQPRELRVGVITQLVGEPLYSIASGRGDPRIVSQRQRNRHHAHFCGGGDFAQTDPDA